MKPTKHFEKRREEREYNTGMTLFKVQCMHP
jgi:hypothetical protein